MKHLLLILFLISSSIETRSQDFKKAHLLLIEAIKKAGPSYRGLLFDYKLTLDSTSDQFIFQSKEFDDNFNISISNYFNKKNGNKQHLTTDVSGEGKFDELSGEPLFFMRKYSPFNNILWTHNYFPNRPLGGYTSIINKWYTFLDNEYKSGQFPWKNFLVDTHVDFDINEKGEVSSNDELGLLFLKNNKIRFSGGIDDGGKTKSVMKLRIPQYKTSIDSVTFYNNFYWVKDFKLGYYDDLIINILPLDSLGENVFYTRKLSEIHRRYTIVSVVRDQEGIYALPMIHRGNVQTATRLIEKLLALEIGKHLGGSDNRAFDRIYFYTENLK